MVTNLVFKLFRSSFIKEAVITAGASGTAVGGWKAYDVLFTKEDEVVENVRDQQTFNSDMKLDEVLKIDYSRTNEYHRLFTPGDCVNKILPGEIEFGSYDIDPAEIEQVDKFNADAFSGNNFKIVKGCANVHIRYNDYAQQDKKKDNAVVGKMELVLWNHKGVAMMQSIISNNKSKIDFINKLTFLNKKKGSDNWEVKNSAIWVDAASALKDANNIEFKFGKDKFSVDLKSSNFVPSASRSSKELEKEYKKWSIWFFNEEDDDVEDSLIGYWTSTINKIPTDMWTSRDNILQHLGNKKILWDKAKLFYTNKKWHKVKWFSAHWATFNNFDKFHTLSLKDPRFANGRRSSMGKWW